MKYVWEFGMRSMDDSLSYYLVFATKNPLGMESMKEAMKAVQLAEETVAGIARAAA